MAILGSVTRLDKSNTFVAVFSGRKIEDDTIIHVPATRQHATLEGTIKQARAGMGAKGEVFALPVNDTLWLLSDEKPAEKAPKAK